MVRHETVVHSVQRRPRLREPAGRPAVRVPDSVDDPGQCSESLPLGGNPEGPERATASPVDNHLDVPTEASVPNAESLMDVSAVLELQNMPAMEHVPTSEDLTWSGESEVPLLEESHDLASDNILSRLFDLKMM